MDGVWNDAGSLEVSFVGVDLSEDTIEGVVAENRDSNAFTDTVEAETLSEAFQAMTEQMDAFSIWDCRGAEPRRVYTQPDEEDGA
ncbi:hypothetical protein [Streptomyces sp. Midd1]|uniref:hypothetical protein n=1 Tax=Streptomyces sp. Midd3 TaxID=3161191 RepID=UPI0034DB223A